jgi:hypothetical protein
LIWRYKSWCSVYGSAWIEMAIMSKNRTMFKLSYYVFDFENKYYSLFLINKGTLLYDQPSYNQACQPLNVKSKYTMYSTGFWQTDDPFSKCIRYFVFMVRDYVCFTWGCQLILKYFSDNIPDWRKLHLEILDMKHTDG